MIHAYQIFYVVPKAIGPHAQTKSVTVVTSGGTDAAKAALASRGVVETDVLSIGRVWHAEDVIIDLKES